MKILENDFTDLYLTDKNEIYITDKSYENSLKKIEPDDKELFIDGLHSIIHKDSSYSFVYEGVHFRVECSKSLTGLLWCLRRMPQKVPSIHNLTYDIRFLRYMLSLADASGLILWSGATGQGKTTAISALLHEYLTLNGGFAYTIEDPAEMPLEGEYNAINGSIGVCKQIEVDNDDWKTPLKGALRSHPKYILIGEIRTADAAIECLRAAISGHLVLATIHAGTITDAIHSLVKYATPHMSEESAYNTLSRGILAVINQELVGSNRKQPMIDFLFANPELNNADATRSIIRSGNINLASIIERQKIRLSQGKPIFEL